MLFYIVIENERFFYSKKLIIKEKNYNKIKMILV